MRTKITVGDLRHQTAYSNHDRPVVLTSKNPEVQKILNTLTIARCYPDTRLDGDWISVFKIEVEASD